MAFQSAGMNSCGGRRLREMMVQILSLGLDVINCYIVGLDGYVGCTGSLD